MLLLISHELMLRHLFYATRRLICLRKAKKIILLFPEIQVTKKIFTRVAAKKKIINYVSEFFK